MTLADFTRADLIIESLRGTEPLSVVQELGSVLVQQACLPNQELFVDAVMKREALANTNLEGRLAFPHARICIETPCFALGRAPRPILWGGNGSSVSVVSLIFLIAVPEDDATNYLALISGLSRCAKDVNFLSRLGSAESRDRIFELLRSISLRVEPSRRASVPQLSPNSSR